jgi:hypothetical protein
LLYYFALWIFEETNIVRLYAYILWGAERFRQRLDFLLDLAENVRPLIKYWQHWLSYIWWLSVGKLWYRYNKWRQTNLSTAELSIKISNIL